MPHDALAPYPWSCSESYCIKRDHFCSLDPLAWEELCFFNPFSPTFFLFVAKM